MCGIAGVVAWRADPGVDTRVQAMAMALQHRGPDDAVECGVHAPGFNGGEQNLGV